VVIVPIVKSPEDREAVESAAADLAAAAKAAGIRVKVDAGSEKTPGWKFNFWEMKVRQTELPEEAPTRGTAEATARRGVVAWY
jgi:Anticodon binding domain